MAWIANRPGATPAVVRKGDTLLTGLVQRGREILARRLAEALQRRPGWTFDDAHAAIERLARLLAPQAFPTAGQDN